jgi:hypothetical protein
MVIILLQLHRTAPDALGQVLGSLLGHPQEKLPLLRLPQKRQLAPKLVQLAHVPQVVDQSERRVDRARPAGPERQTTVGLLYLGEVRLGLLDVVRVQVDVGTVGVQPQQVERLPRTPPDDPCEGPQLHHLGQHSQVLLLGRLQPDPGQEDQAQTVLCLVASRADRLLLLLVPISLRLFLAFLFPLPSPQIFCPTLFAMAGRAFAHHYFRGLVEEEVARVEHKEGQFVGLLEMLGVELRKQVADLGGVVPVTRQHSVLASGQSTDRVDRKGLFLLEVAEETDQGQHVFWAGDVSVSADDLGEGHLPDPHHAAPACVRDVGALEIVVEFGEACAVGEPGGVAEDVEEELVLFLLVVALDLDALSEQVDFLPGFSDGCAAEGVEEPQELETDVEPGVDYLFENSETSRLAHHILITIRSLIDPYSCTYPLGMGGLQGEG